jgi:adenylosuccinate synthase
MNVVFRAVRPLKNWQAAVAVGSQVGDEGKGRVAYHLAQNADVVVRYGGGNNARYTVQVGKEVYMFSYLPIGIVFPGKVNIIADGCLIDLKALTKEIEHNKHRIAITPETLKISERAAVIFPFNKIMANIADKGRGKRQLGTTGRGIGSCTADRDNRIGLRIVDLLDKKSFKAELSRLIQRRIIELREIHGADIQADEIVKALDAENIYQEYSAYIDKLRPHLIPDTALYLNQAHAAGKRILLEGTQGAMHDVVLGLYPYTTAYSTTVGSAFTGTGFSPAKVDEIVGAFKPYQALIPTSRCPFPTKIRDEEAAQIIRDTGQDYGYMYSFLLGKADQPRAPRYIGWLDLFLSRRSTMISGATTLAVTHLDVLDPFKTIRVCTGYRHNGEPLEHFPSSIRVLSEVEPVYEEMPGWRADTTGIRRYRDLPSRARQFLRKIATATEVPISLITVGPDSEQTIHI